MPDGDAIVFSAQRDGEFEDGVGLWEVGVDGRDLHRLSPDDGKFYGPGVPTDDEVLTTRSNFDICISPNFARRGAAARSSAPNGYCEIQDTRGYGMNHDGSNPHFLELDADDKDAPKAHAARNLTAEQIRQKEGLDQLERLVRKATESRAKSEVRKAVVEAVAKDLLWAVGRGSIIGTITGFLMDDGNPGCDGKVGFMQRAKTANIKAGNALYQAMGASVAPHPAMTANLQQAIEATKDIIRQAKPALKGPKKCKQFYAPALQAAEKALPSLERGVVYLHEIDFQSQRRKAYAVARYAVDRYPKVGIQTCEDAKVIQDAIGRGSGKRNYFVYWAPPDVVKYVGISRAFDVRCAKHPAARRPLIHTLNLPPLMFQEARSVEEALIAHFGTKDERANNRFRSPGQLENIVHSISPDRDSYCPRLVLGQMLLLENGYGSYAAAYYTREKVCAGVGGPR